MIDWGEIKTLGLDIKNNENFRTFAFDLVHGCIYKWLNLLARKSKVESTVRGWSMDRSTSSITENAASKVTYSAIGCSVAGPISWIGWLFIPPRQWTLPARPQSWLTVGIQLISGIVSQNEESELISLHEQEAYDIIITSCLLESKLLFLFDLLEVCPIGVRSRRGQDHSTSSIPSIPRQEEKRQKGNRSCWYPVHLHFRELLRCLFH